MEELEELASKLEALGHPVRLKLVATLRLDGPQYLSELAKKAGVSRALAKVHLVRLQRAGIVKSRVVLSQKEAKALRYYELVDFSILVSPDEIVRLMR
ncbi:transcriptional regulator [Sulfodiicoccus acidiphilus]|uniref:Transcriptional regulator n=1 Tax=Sulfodiicoccus acidiphilus TaxID=1670455 RepID=A0A348B557_9CREN|nr:helix-turn-helix domain-containing protein [Sulfodiicoccus acidiphilus]BBD73309.1 transcriptional regulator [Sulfodiicoccus acidiphilus]GGT89212.1 transcriptional regulator [Sulfodiicoccus acidiphilus]